MKTDKSKFYFFQNAEKERKVKNKNKGKAGRQNIQISKQRGHKNK